MSTQASVARWAADGRRLHVVVAAPPVVRQPADLQDLSGAADLIELRLDLLLEGRSAPDVADWVAASPRPVLATVRSRAEGGRFAGPATEAAAVLQEAIAAGARWIDAEAAVAPLLGVLPDGVCLLPSSHGSTACGFEVSPAQAPRVPFEKLARPVEDAEAWRALQALAAKAPRGQPRFLVPYGPLGATRGAFVGATKDGLLYGSAADEAAVVPGQPRLESLLDELRAGEVGPQAALYGLVGEPPARSPSPALHNAVFRAREIEALYVPLPGLSLEAAMALPVHGLSVTTPFKRDALGRADRVDGLARATGAVNTLVREADGSWSGSNSDATALRRVLNAAPRKARAFVLGAGGYARAACWALQQRGYDVRLGARSEPRGRALAAELNVPFEGARCERHPDDAVVVNATPAGADGQVVPCFADADLAGLDVLDAPYGPTGCDTGLVTQAQAQGAKRILDGRALLRAQALDQAVAFGASPDALPEIERVLALALSPPSTLYLLGGRGAGKTTAGRRVAATLGRPFVDLDDEVERISGRAPASWILQDGWLAFREVEHRALERVAARRGLVVACGGGVVDFEPNLPLLSAAGLCVLLQVSPEQAAARCALDSTPRPRWPGSTDPLHEARVLFESRTPAWRTLAQHVVDADAALETVVASIVRFWCE